jgi:hypothetical protein
VATSAAPPRTLAVAISANVRALARSVRPLAVQTSFTHSPGPSDRSFSDFATEDQANALPTKSTPKTPDTMPEARCEPPGVTLGCGLPYVGASRSAVVPFELGK